MDGMRRALLVVGVLNLAAFGVLACGGRASESTDVAALTKRVEALETWKLGQEQLAMKHGAFVRSQVELNESYQGYMSASQEHAKNVDRTLAKQQEAMGIINKLLHDLIAKIKK